MGFEKNVLPVFEKRQNKKTHLDTYQFCKPETATKAKILLQRHCM